jgi:hypothetical protein
VQVFFLLFVYICITVGESIIKRERIEISLISLIPPINMDNTIAGSIKIGISY